MKPENVRLELPDGTEIPCELQHEGIDDDGIDQWIALCDHPFRPGVDKFRADVLPARTGISFQVAVRTPE